jgi:hypothetical protein
MTYRITDYSRNQARKLGVSIRLSSNPKKKLDVYKNGTKVASIGATGYGDYGTFMETKGKAYADERRRLYRIRHKGENNFSLKILW